MLLKNQGLLKSIFGGHLKSNFKLIYTEWQETIP